MNCFLFTFLLCVFCVLADQELHYAGAQEFNDLIAPRYSRLPSEYTNVFLGVHRCPKTKLCCLSSQHCCGNNYGCCFNNPLPRRIPALPCGKPPRH